jgi:Domain of unknown function (DUF4326)
MCNVVNKYKHKSISTNLYIGRGSLLGNPYTHLEGATLAEFKVSTREESITNYETYFYNVLLKNLKIIELLNTITDQTNLVCFCKPKDCHGDVIQQWYRNKTTNNYESH